MGTTSDSGPTDHSSSRSRSALRERGFEVSPVRDLVFAARAESWRIPTSVPAAAADVVAVCTSVTAAAPHSSIPCSARSRSPASAVRISFRMPPDDGRHHLLGIRTDRSLSTVDNVRSALWNDGWSGRRGSGSDPRSTQPISISANRLVTFLDNCRWSAAARRESRTLSRSIPDSSSPMSRPAHLDHVQVEIVLRHLQRLTLQEPIVIIATHDKRLPCRSCRRTLYGHARGPGATDLSNESWPTTEFLFNQGDPGRRVFWSSADQWNSSGSR